MHPVNPPNPRRNGLLIRLAFVFLGRGKFVRGILWGLVGMGFGALLFAYIQAGEIYDYQDTVDGVHLPEVDAIICLAGGRGRIAAAGDVWYRYWELSQAPLTAAGRSPAPRKPPVLYISGMGRLSNWKVIERHVRRGVLASLKPESVVLETESANTVENAEYVARYAKERGWEKILLMTSSYHMRRARLIFDRTLAYKQNPVRVETLSIFQEPFEPGEWREGIHGIRVTVIEYLKWVYYKTFWAVSPVAAVSVDD